MDATPNRGAPDGPELPEAMSSPSVPALAEAFNADDDRWFRALAETSSTAIMVLRETFLYANPAAEQLLGYSARELSRRSPPSVVHPDFRDRVRQRFEARLRGEEVPPRYEMKILRPDGQVRWIDYSAQRIALGTTRAILATAIDITESRRTERALMASENHLLMAQRAGRCFTWEWEVENDRLSVSEYAVELLGLSLVQLEGSSDDFFPFISAHHREAVRRAVRRALREDEDFSIELPVKTSAGRTRWLANRGRALRGENGRAFRLIGTSTDITETKRREHRLRLLVEGTSRATGEAFFSRLVRHLAEAFRARCAFVASIEAPGRGRMLSFWKDGGYAEVGGVQIEGRLSPLSPTYRDRDGRRFPLATLTAALGTPSYLVTTMVGSRGQPIGLLGILGDSPLDRDPATVSLLEMFAQRSAAEVDRLEALQDLSREKEHAQVTLASIGDGVIRTDAEGKVDFLNPVASWILGWRPEEAEGRPVSAIFRALDEANRKEASDAVALCLREQKLIIPPMPKVVARRTDGAEFSVRDSVAPIRDLSGRIVGAVLVFKDVTELRGMQREMRYLEEHDPLTGLINRQSFEKQLGDTLDAGGEGGASHFLCLLDLDEFQLVNDTFGPAAGDEILKRVATFIRGQVRESDVVARLGSDEFGILFSHCSQDLARRLAESIRDGLATLEFTRRQQTFGCSAGFGLVPFDGEAADVAEILTLAHGACFLARQQGRNQIHEYCPGDTAMADRLEEISWVHRIRSALEEDRFLLYQQPFAALKDGGLPISEIFLRLAGEGGEILPPGPLIQAAERYHLITAIDRWVVRRALQILGGDSPAGEEPERIYSINLSGQSLSEDGFWQDIAEELQRSSLDPRRICFEITETAAIANFEAAQRFFTRLRALGCRFLLDDFGSGMSSLAYLKNLPVDYLKIDGEFVLNIVQDPVQRAMVESIHRISRVLGLKTIGECVEGEDSLETLRRIGIDYAQGFWLAEPMPFG